MQENSKFKVFLSADHIVTTTLFANVAADFGNARLPWAEYSISSSVTNHDSQGLLLIAKKVQSILKNEDLEL